MVKGYFNAFYVDNLAKDRRILVPTGNFINLSTHLVMALYYIATATVVMMETFVMALDNDKDYITIYYIII